MNIAEVLLKLIRINWYCRKGMQYNILFWLRKFRQILGRIFILADSWEILWHWASAWGYRNPPWQRKISDLPSKNYWYSSGIMIVFYWQNWLNVYHIDKSFIKSTNFVTLGYCDPCFLIIGKWLCLGGSAKFSLPLGSDHFAGLDPCLGGSHPWLILWIDKSPSKLMANNFATCQYSVPPYPLQYIALADLIF